MTPSAQTVSVKIQARSHHHTDQLNSRPGNGYQPGFLAASAEEGRDEESHHGETRGPDSTTGTRLPHRTRTRNFPAQLLDAGEDQALAGASSAPYDVPFG